MRTLELLSSGEVCFINILAQTICTVYYSALNWWYKTSGEAFSPSALQPRMLTVLPVSRGQAAFLISPPSYCQCNYDFQGSPLCAGVSVAFHKPPQALSPVQCLALKSKLLGSRERPQHQLVLFLWCLVPILGSCRAPLLYCGLGCAHSLYFTHFCVVTVGFQVTVPNIAEQRPALHCRRPLALFLRGSRGWNLASRDGNENGRWGWVQGPLEGMSGLLWIWVW